MSTIHIRDEVSLDFLAEVEAEIAVDGIGSGELVTDAPSQLTDVLGPGGGVRPLRVTVDGLEELRGVELRERTGRGFRFIYLPDA